MGRFWGWFVLIFSFQTLWAQLGYQHQVVPMVAPDSMDLTYYGRKDGGKAAATIIGLNLGVWAFDRYVVKGDFAYISLNTMKANLRKGFVWDNDNMGTNMFLHPYHGNLYFNAARSNGFNYWQSGLFALGGSAMWEFFMENEFPSANDIVATPIGGMALGEMLYRASDIVLDDRAMGRERFGRELAAFLISPMRGLTRVLEGDAWRYRSTSGRQFGIPHVCLAFSLGTRALEFKGDILDKGVGLTAEVDLEYGDRFSTDFEKPFDFFTLRGGLDFQSSQPVLSQLNVIGRLLNYGWIDTPKTKLNAGLYQHLDYYDSDTISDLSAVTPYKFATPASIGGGLQFQRKGIKNWDLSASFYGNAVLIGAVLSDHYFLDQRNYNIANGFGIKTRINALYKKNKFSASLGHEYYRMFTWKDYPQDIDWTTANPHTLSSQGDRSQAFVHISEVRLDYRIAKKLFLTGSFMRFQRDTNYDFYPDVSSTSTATRLMLTYVM